LIERIKKQLQKDFKNLKIFFNNQSLFKKTLIIIIFLSLLDVLTTISSLYLSSISTNLTPDSNKKQLTISNIKDIDFIKKNKIIFQATDDGFVSILVDEKDVENKIYKPILHMPYFSIIENIEPLFIDNNISYSWEDSKSSFISNFTFISLLKEHSSQFILILFFIYIFEKQGLLDSKDKFKRINETDIEGSIDDLIGIDDIKEELNQLENVLNNRKMYKDLGINDVFNILFAGPPGTGKTKIASYLAKKTGLPLIVGTGNVETGFVNGGVNTIKDLFQRARTEAKISKKKACIVFLDEAQTLLKKRGSSREHWADDSANELLAQLDGVKTSDDIDIIFIAASNFDDKNHSFDEAMMRRFKKKIFFSLPTRNDRKKIFDFFISKIKHDIISPDIDTDYLSEITVGSSPANIETIVQEATLLSVANKELISTSLLFKAFELINIGKTKRKNEASHQKNRNIISKHELGHFIQELCIAKNKANVIDLSLDNLDLVKQQIPTLKISIESISQVNALGYVLSKEIDDNLKTKKDLENDIVILYGGLASEKIFFNIDDNDDNITIGSSNDIEKVSSIFNLMINKLSMYSNSKLNFGLIDNIDINDSTQELLHNKSEELFNIALSNVSNNKELISFLDLELQNKFILTINDIFSLIEKFIHLTEKK
jgi:cell division protease FtsH